jgi:hypothetical protein
MRKWVDGKMGKQKVCPIVNIIIKENLGRGDRMIAFFISKITEITAHSVS